MNKNEIWVFNPDYKFKSDLDRICLYSTKELIYDSSKDWDSYIHPFQAIILSSFDGETPLYDIYTAISSRFHITKEAAEKIIEPYLGNDKPIFTEWETERVYFPKNILIPASHLKTEPSLRDLQQITINSKEISLVADRAHKAPHNILWMLTNKCVTNCAYCYADKKTQYLPLSTDKCLGIIDEAFNLGVKYIDVIGGEVFLRKDWDLLIGKIVRLGMSPSYISTKMPVSRQILEKLIETRYKNVIQISLDSADDDVLKELIHTQNGYLKSLIDGMTLLDENNFKLQVDTILTRRTASVSNLEVLASIISRIKNLVYWEIRVPEYSIYSSERFNKEKCSMSQIEEISDFINNSLKKSFAGKIIYNDDAITDRLYSNGPSDPCFQGGLCGLLKSNMFILPDGKVSVCEQLYWHPEFIIGDLTKDSIDKIWQSPKALSLFNMSRELLRKESTCTKCGFSEKCLADKRRCIVKIIKAYGAENWDYPDPRCKFAPKAKNEIEYK